MATETTVNNLVINKLTKAQYEAIQNPSETELYLVPDEIDNAPTSGSNNPVKSGGIYTALQGKQNTLVSGTNIKTINNESILGSGNISVSAELPSNLAFTSDDDGEGIVPSDGIRAESVAAGATMSINADVVTVVTGTVGTATITLQVPNDNLAHVWDILMTTNSTVAITFAMSNSATILYPDGFSVSASKAVEISVIGVGTRYYLRYGEFA
jgi:hypothetical protein